MVQKRHFREGGEEESDFPNRSKRPNPFTRDVSEDSVQEFISKFEIPCRIWVRQEVERVLSSYSRSSHHQIDTSPGDRIFELHFVDKLPATLFTNCRVVAEDGAAVKVVLRDASSKSIIRSGPLSSAKVTLCVLDGDFNKEDREEWSPREFTSRRVQQREGKKPLVTGTLVLTLKEGVAYVENVSFTDNSSWTRSGKFRLGAITSDGTIREGISNIFKVKDHRGESYKKHERPSLSDEVWRLKKIAKDGASYTKLTSNGICDVKQFLRTFVTNPLWLRKILGNKISDKAWNTIIEHATACLLDENDLLQYKAADGTLLLLNSIYQVDGVIFDGGRYLSLDMLNISQKLWVEDLRKIVYNNLNCVVPIDHHSFFARQTVLQCLQSSYSNPSLGCLAPQNVNFPVEQDQLEIHFNSHNIQAAHTYGVEASQIKVSAAETCHQIGAFDSVLRNGLIGSDSYDEFPADGYGWDAPLGFTDPLAANENFQVATSPWQGNGFFEYKPSNPALGIVSSDFGIRISRNGKPRASWCKIRAVIKWKMVKSFCQKYGKASKYAY